MEHCASCLQHLPLLSTWGLHATHGSCPWHWRHICYRLATRGLDKGEDISTIINSYEDSSLFFTLPFHFAGPSSDRTIPVSWRWPPALEKGTPHSICLLDPCLCKTSLCSQPSMYHVSLLCGQVRNWSHTVYWHLIGDVSYWWVRCIVKPKSFIVGPTELIWEAVSFEEPQQTIGASQWS